MSTCVTRLCFSNLAPVRLRQSQSTRASLLVIPHNRPCNRQLPLPRTHFPPTCDMSRQSEPQSSNFTTLFESALQEYAKQTGKPWTEHPLAQQLEQCYSLESVSDVLQEQAQAFTLSRGDSRVMKSLKSATSVLYTLFTNNVLRDAISVVRRTRWWVLNFPDVLFYSHSLLRSQYLSLSLSYLVYVSFTSRLCIHVSSKCTRRQRTSVPAKTRSPNCSRRSKNS
jgi:hypothetical protein